MVFEKIDNNIYVFIDEDFYDGVMGAIELPNKLVMIDSGIHVAKMKNFKEKVEKETGKKFEYLVLTHHHTDHIMGNQFFADCKIIAGQGVHDYMIGMKERWPPEKVEELANKQEDPSQYRGLLVTPPNVVLEDGYTIEDEGVKVVVKRTGGHTKDSAYIYCSKYSALFAGDNLFAGCYPYGGDETCNPDIWLNAYEEFLAINAKYTIPGHGRDWTIKSVTETIDFMKNMKELMIKRDSEGKTEEEIVKECFDIEFYPDPNETEHDRNLKNMTLKRWYAVWIQGKE